MLRSGLEILRAEAESSLRGEFRRMQVIHMLMGLSQKSSTKQSMNAEFESIQEKIHNMEIEMRYSMRLHIVFTALGSIITILNWLCLHVQFLSP